MFNKSSMFSFDFYLNILTIQRVKMVEHIEKNMFQKMLYAVGI